jgi:hypothetical protein
MRENYGLIPVVVKTILMSGISLEELSKIKKNLRKLGAS